MKGKSTSNNVQVTILTLAFVFTFALLPRVCMVLIYPSEPISDAADYDRLAAALSAGNGFVAETGEPTAWRPPGYPFFLAFIYKICGVSHVSAFLVQALIGALMVVAIWYLARQIFGDKEAIIAGILASLHQSFLYLPRVLLSENLALLLLVVCLILIVRQFQKPSNLKVLLLGALLGISMLVRGAAIFLIATIFIYLSWETWKAAKSFAKVVTVSGILVLGIVIAIAPWTVRNGLAFGQLAPLSTQGGVTLYSSYFPPRKDGKLIWGNLPGTEDPVVAQANQVGNEVQVSTYLRKETFRKLSEEPSLYFKLLPGKFLSLLAPYDWEWFPKGAEQTKSVNYTYILLSILGIWGVIILRLGRHKYLFLLLLTPIATFIQTLIFYGSPRFRLLAETTLILLGCVAVKWILFGRHLPLENRK